MRLIQAAGVTVRALVVVLIVAAAVTLPLGTVGGARSSVSQSPAAAAGSSVGTRLQATSSPLPTAGAASPSPAPTQLPVTGIDVGQLAPDFELPTPEGEKIRLSDFRGQPVWVNFWAPWCPACRTEMPRLEGFNLEHADDGLVILGVGVRDSPESMRAYASEVGVTYPIVVDGNGAVANGYQALALPVHYWLDGDGIIRDWAFGELPPDLLAASLETILPQTEP